MTMLANRRVSYTDTRVPISAVGKKSTAPLHVGEHHSPALLHRNASEIMRTLDEKLLEDHEGHTDLPASQEHLTHSMHAATSEMLSQKLIQIAAKFSKEIHSITFVDLWNFFDLSNLPH